MNRFYFNSSSSTSTSSLDSSSLPYPQPLPRSAFLSPAFSPTTFLSTLHNRHQTLEDLRAELRARSQELARELLDLVNENYADFVGLGRDLRGGEEKVEEVRVGVLGVRRGVEGLVGLVGERRAEVEGLVGEMRRVGRERRVGRGLLVVEGGLAKLEERLGVERGRGAGEGDGDKLGGFSEGGGSDDDEEEEEGGQEGGVSVMRLQRNVEQFVKVKRVVERIGADHPFLVKQENRVLRIRQTLLLDLGGALRQMDLVNEQDKGRTLNILGLYRDMGETEEALLVLKERKR